MSDEFSPSSCGAAPEILEARLREQREKEAKNAPPAPPSLPQTASGAAQPVVAENSASQPPATPTIAVSDDPRLVQLETLPDGELFALAAKHGLPPQADRSSALQALLAKGVTSPDATVAATSVLPPAPPPLSFG